MSPSIWVYDIECTPNLAGVWGLYNQDIHYKQIVVPQDILCFAAHKIGEKTVEAHASWDDYEAMIRRLHEIMDDADYLVGYNHVAYDNKHVRAAFLKMELPPPSPFRSIDLLKVVKKQFRLPSHRMDYVCKVLGLDVKVGVDFDTWMGCMNGDEAARRKMIRYNKRDVRMTTQLFERLRPWIDGLNIPLYSGDEEHNPQCPRCGSSSIQSRGWAYTTTYRYRRFVCTECGGWMRARKSEPVVNAVYRSV